MNRRTLYGTRLPKCLWSLLICCALGQPPLAGQEVCYPCLNKWQVIAPNGLRLRKAPGLETPVLAGIPFGDTLVLLSAESFGFEVLSLARDYGYHEYSYKDSIIHGQGDMPISGNWRLVEWHGLKGYVLDAYLAAYPCRNIRNCTTLRRERHEMDRQVVLMHRGMEMQSLCFNPTCYHWYGVYAQEGQAEIKAISIEFIAAVSEYYGDLVQCLTKEHKDLLYIIGSLNELSPRRFRATQFEMRYWWTEDSTPIVSWEEDTYSWTLAPPKDGKHPRSLTVRRKDMPAPKRLWFGKYMDVPYRPEFVGDIDGDGKEDYVVYSNTEFDASVWVLYLSSLRNWKDGLRPAAYAYKGY